MEITKFTDLNLIGKRIIKPKFAIGDKVKNPNYEYEFIVGQIFISARMGIHYSGNAYDKEGEWVLGSGYENNLELVEKNYVTSQDVKEETNV